MKKLFLFLSVVQLGYAQNVVFEDPNFKASIIATYSNIDANNDNEISFEEALTLTNIKNLQLINFQKINSAVGIEAFINLTELDLRKQNLTSIDLSANVNIKTLNLIENKIEGTLDLSTLTQMTNLDLNTNKITSLLLPEDGKIRFLYANDNLLTSVDISEQAELKRVFFVRNNLSSIDLSSNIALERINFDNNQLTSLDLSGLQLLSWMSVKENSLEEIIFNNNPALKSLLLQDNNLTELNFKDDFPNTVTMANLTGNDAFTKIITDCEGDTIAEITPSGIEIEADCSASVEEVSINKVQTYPNPFEDIINFSNEIEEVSVFDFSGRKVYSDSNKALNSINLSELSKGSYIIKFKSNGINTSTVIIKK